MIVETSKYSSVKSGGEHLSVKDDPQAIDTRRNLQSKKLDVPDSVVNVRVHRDNGPQPKEPVKQVLHDDTGNQLNHRREEEVRDSVASRYAKGKMNKYHKAPQKFNNLSDKVDEIDFNGQEERDLNDDVMVTNDDVIAADSESDHDDIGNGNQI